MTLLEKLTFTNHIYQLQNEPVMPCKMLHVSCDIFSKYIRIT